MTQTLKWLHILSMFVSVTLRWARRHSGAAVIYVMVVKPFS